MDKPIYHPETDAPRDFDKKLYNTEQLVDYARVLAGTHTVGNGNKSNYLLQRLNSNEQVLKSYTHRTLAQKKPRNLVPASQWLIDNYYLVEEQILLSRSHLPKEYSRGLPAFADGPYNGLPRVYGIVFEYVRHVDAQIDTATLIPFIEAYQQISELNLGELWAIPIMLRLSLIENLTRITLRLEDEERDRQQAAEWIEEIKEAAKGRPSAIIEVIARMSKEDIALSSAFVSEFSQGLTSQNPLQAVRTWLDQRLREEGSSTEEILQTESQLQAADQLSVTHTINSLRSLAATDWRDVIEELSLVERILRTDPANIYPAMDFSTRDHYRHQIEALAKCSRLSETAVASKAVELAESVCREDPSGRGCHVGYYLIDGGLNRLSKEINAGFPLHTRMRKNLLSHPLPFYCGGILVAALLAGSLFAVWLLSTGIPPGDWRFILMVALFTLYASQLGVEIMNWLSPVIIKPEILPKLDYSEGIPSGSKTMVVIPTMISDPEGVEELVERLEIHYLSNTDFNIRFGLLTDFPDAPDETMPYDADILQLASSGIEALNRKYGAGGEPVFFLFHRPRKWNPREGVWMGHERKRGKLMDFTRCLRGARGDDFSLITGDTTVLSDVKYVITLDTDTQLPGGSARKLAGAMAHLLNRPIYAGDRRTVVKGYGIIQPRVGINMVSSRCSVYSRMISSDAGIDPYTRAVSDVYQDIFREGSFIGKGIYDVDAFLQVLADSFPDDKILSHDLLESTYMRSGLLTDVEVFESCPAGYDTEMLRRHRWTRGDWQLLQWLLPRVPTHSGVKVKNPVPALGRWKLFDNLRRSLIPPLTLLLLVLAVVILPGTGLKVEGLVVLLPFIPSLLNLLSGLLRKMEPRTVWLVFKETVRSFLRQVVTVVFWFAALPYEAYMNLSAIGVTLWRLSVSHRHTLLWRTSSAVEKNRKDTAWDFYKMMWPAPLFAAACGSAAYFAGGNVFLWTLPLCVLWILSPLAAWLVSRPAGLRKDEISTAGELTLHRIARKTWGFFETFANSRENWLPPDNFQMVPDAVVATRTSPTNIGLSLLANLSAHDLGYLSAEKLLDRSKKCFDTLDRLPKYKGHLYNWYGTRSLEPLHPLYISTVDSGNLAGHLVAFSEGLKQLVSAPVYTPLFFRGLLDTVRVVREYDAANGNLTALEELCAQAPSTIPEALVLTDKILGTARKAVASFDSSHSELCTWGKLLIKNINDLIRELRWFWPGEGDSLTDGYGTLPQSLTARLRRIEQGESLYRLARMEQEVTKEISGIPGNIPAGTGEEGELRRNALNALHEGLRITSERARSRIRAITSLVRRSDALSEGMDFAFLYEPSKKLFTIGYNQSEERMDNSSYDLMASEARLASYLAIARGEVPEEHWFSLGRLVTISHGNPVLLSWSGSMFEYLMPLLVMPDYDHTLLSRTYRGAIKEQMDYAARLGVPWGISESGYNRTDTLMNYQYKAFGVPSLGLKRGLSEELVITPYATVMSLMVAPGRACGNMAALSGEGYEGIYGFYEAADYTPSHLRRGEKSVVIRSFMAHHQGMSLVSLNNVLCGNIMQQRFMSCPKMKAYELLLQEKIPRTVAPNVISDDSQYELEGVHPLFPEEPGSIRRFTAPGTAPEVNLLSNGNYHVMVNHAGSGYSRFNDMSVTRWREDPTSDSLGLYIYMKEEGKEPYDSATLQPTVNRDSYYSAVFTQPYAEFIREKDGVETRTTICVSPEDDLEIRRIEMTNRSAHERAIEMTSYCEAVISPVGADEAHPAFGNLFVETEFKPASGAVLATRRPRSAEEKPLHLYHMLVGDDGLSSDVSCQTSRNGFIGRGRSLASPAAMDREGALDGETGAVLDPCISLRRMVKVPAAEKVTVCVILGVAESRRKAEQIIAKYRNIRMTERSFDMAWTHSHVLLTQLGITESEAQTYNKIAGSLVYSNPDNRSGQAVLKANRKGQDGLWSYGISGDLPIVLVKVAGAKGLELVRQIVLAHAYWRMKGLAVEVVILNEDSSVYRQSVHNDITNLVSSGIEAGYLDRPAGIFVRRIEQVPQEDLDLLQAAARVVLNDRSGGLSKQLDKITPGTPAMPLLKPSRKPYPYVVAETAAGDLLFDNGTGGFTPGGREYVIRLNPGQSTPAPWCNVLANENLGTVVSESGSAYTWAVNAHLFRLTPWNNDPVKDHSGEAFYIRDDETGEFWSPAPFPARGNGPYLVRHGFGYSVYTHSENGIESEMTVFVAKEAPVKFTVLKLRNTSPRTRKISVAGYYEWVLADKRQKSLLHVRTETDPETGVVFARNYYDPAFAGRIAFADVDGRRSFTCDRTEFIGRNGTLASPRAMKYERLSGRTGAGYDPCAALHAAVELKPGAAREVSFRLGSAVDKNEMRALTDRFRQPDEVAWELEKVTGFWNETLSAVQVATPDESVNFMANGWLLYQTLACRMWARSGFYQSGGAYGFRDQLQDAMALVHAHPSLVREQILRAAGRQFPQGDVQHWWHPPTGRGVRTHFSDDYLWLPYVTCKYIEDAGDTDILDQQVPFIEGRPLGPDEESYYDLPGWTPESDTLYGHCVRSIRYGLKFGSHGLPLMGCGDWNDGMNLVGMGGRGESVWLGFFLYDVLQKFSAVARLRGDDEFGSLCLEEAARLKDNIRLNAWDGEWYIRAFFDNGDPLGTKERKECRIDSIPQSWSVLSGAGDPERSVEAMKQVDRQLVNRKLGLVRLFTLPFDKSPQDPGYIKGYIPGVRENGGQYTHAAIWTAMAFAEMGEVEKAWEIFGLLNPVNHGDTAERADIYKVEPYVVAADVYTARQHPGRGGWTWYTGSSAWMYRLLIETLLGLKRRGNTLLLEPKLPAKWNGAGASYRYGETTYRITFRRRAADEELLLLIDGKPADRYGSVEMENDGKPHEVLMLV